MKSQKNKELKSQKEKITNKNSIKTKKGKKQVHKQPKKELNRPKYTCNIYDEFILQYSKLNTRNKEQINGQHTITFQDEYLHYHCNEILNIAKELKYAAEYEAIDKKDFYNNLIRLYIEDELSAKLSK